MAAPLAVDHSDPREAPRLAALHALGVLDTEYEERFDRLTELACRVFGVPIALISLVGENRQWFKSRYGIEIAETPRDVSFCTRTVGEDRPFVVTDARRDERFADNPFVVGLPHIRSYAGAPLRAGTGEAIGTFCIIDRRARTFTADDIAQLQFLADLAGDEMRSSALHRGLMQERRDRAGAELAVARKNAELGEVRLQAAFANRAKTLFLNNMAHELRTPLNAIIGFSELMQTGAMGEQASDRQRQYLQMIHDSGQHLLSVFNQILRMSSIELGQLNLDIGPVAVDAPIAAVVAALHVRAAKRGISIACTNADSGLHVRASADALHQVLQCVTDNAVKFSKDGAQVVISVDAKDGQGRITIADTGEGIPPEMLDVVCEPFAQADQRIARRFEGAGLGLAIAKALVTAQGGHLQIDSEVGQGTRVTIALPTAEGPP